MLSNLALNAMLFAREAHQSQRRKYSGNLYSEHLGEVAGIVGTVAHELEVSPDVAIAVSWLHDVVEDKSFTGVSEEQILAQFGFEVHAGVIWLTDQEEGNRAKRKQLAAERIARAPAWCQTVKYADLISNAPGIRANDPNFAEVYFAEKRKMLSLADRGHSVLREMALNLVK